MNISAIRLKQRPKQFLFLKRKFPESYRLINLLHNSFIPIFCTRVPFTELYQLFKAHNPTFDLFNLDRLGEINEKILTTQSQTIERLRVKARSVCWARLG